MKQSELKIKLVSFGSYDEDEMYYVDEVNKLIKEKDKMIETLIQATKDMNYYMPSSSIFNNAVDKVKLIEKQYKESKKS